VCQEIVADHYVRIGWVSARERDMMTSIIADLERMRRVAKL
jgi:hypothetical protein